MGFKDRRKNVLKIFRRFPLDFRAVTAKEKVTKEILTTQEYFERIKEETRNTLAVMLTPQEIIKLLQIKSQIKDTLRQLKTNWRPF